MNKLKFSKKREEEYSNNENNFQIYCEKQINLNHGINSTSANSSETDSFIQTTPKFENEDKHQIFEKIFFIKFYITQLLLFIPFFLGIMCYLITLEPCMKDYDSV